MSRTNLILLVAALALALAALITFLLSRAGTEIVVNFWLFLAPRQQGPALRQQHPWAPRQLPLALILALLSLAAAPAAAHAGFGIKEFSATATNKGGSVDLQAGSHPYEYTLSLTMNQDEKGKVEGRLRELRFDLPPGLVGNPLAVPRCPGALFEGLQASCPAETAIGVVEFTFEKGLEGFQPIYNLTPPLGRLASVGFSILEVNALNEASLRTGSDYGVSVSDQTLPTNVELQSIKARIWGVPAEPIHNHERGICLETGEICPGPGGIARPFLSLPSSCNGPLTTSLTVTSLEEPDNPVTESIFSTDEFGNPASLFGCALPEFRPKIASQPETAATDSPTGLHFGLEVPQSESTEQPATAHLKDATVTLPAGLSINPSAADGLAACSSAQIDLHGAGPANCPAAAKVGTVSAESPAVDHPLPGSVYLAKQGDNPFGSLIALYVVIEDPLTGVIVKLAGRVDLDPQTGQLVTTFKENPQLPVSSFNFAFNGGPRASLTTPQTCGPYTTTTDLTPWSAPEGADAFPTDSFTLSSAPGGGPCAASEAQMPNSPGFEAGSANPMAGEYSPFVLKLSRENGSQRFGALAATLPRGVSAKLAGVTECSDAQIAAAAARSGAGQGALELAAPSCPASSQVGVANVGAGSGNPFFVQGNVYLAGPYEGAPLSFAIITPAVAGPFDLGTVVVRSPLFVDEETAQGTVRSDPIPKIFAGVPLDIRTIIAKIDRPGFVRNPTSCEAKTLSAQETSLAGAVATLSQRFQVGGCRGLDYTPKISVSMKGQTKRAGHPALTTVLRQPADQANAKTISLTLPPTEFIDPSHVSNPCTRPQFAAGNCPPSSVLGTATVKTPLLAKPLEGKVYFRANGGARKLPDVVLDLHGQVHIVLVGFVDSVKKKGSESSRTRTTFAEAPDAPLSEAVVRLKGGKEGLLQNSANICKVKNVATIKMIAQNNKVKESDQAISTPCKTKKKK